MSIGPLRDEIKSGVPTWTDSSLYIFVSPTTPVVSDPILLLKCINKSLLSLFFHLFLWGSRSPESRALVYALILHYLSNPQNQKLILPRKRFTKTLQDFIIWWKILQVFTIFNNSMKRLPRSYYILWFMKYSTRFYKIL